MKLLVSVSNATEALAALAGGADVIDAKDPIAGALGAVTIDTFRNIHARVGGACPVSAALGDASDRAHLESVAHAFADAGAAFVKVGFAGIADGGRIEALISAAVRGATAADRATCAVVPVAYADADPRASIALPALIGLAARAGASGVLLDTADKKGPGLRDLIRPCVLAAWVKQAHDAGLFAALAGTLAADDLPPMRDIGADVAGVRGAACEGGRTGRVTVERVRHCRAACATFSAFQEAT